MVPSQFYFVDHSSDRIKYFGKENYVKLKGCGVQSNFYRIFKIFRALDSVEETAKTCGCEAHLSIYIWGKVIFRS